MYKIRQIKYAQNSISVQVYKIENRKRIIIRHIGTARNEQELSDLMILGYDFIKKISKQLTFFDHEQSGNILHLDKTEFIGVYYGFIYEFISKLIIKIGFDNTSLKTSRCSLPKIEELPNFVFIFRKFGVYAEH